MEKARSTPVIKAIQFKRFFLVTILLVVLCPACVFGEDRIIDVDLTPKPIADYIIKQAPVTAITIIKSTKSWQEFWEKLGGCLTPKKAAPWGDQVVNQWTIPEAPARFKNQMVLLYWPKRNPSTVTETYFTNSKINIIFSPIRQAHAGMKPSPPPKMPPILCYLLKKSNLPIGIEGIEDFVQPNPVASYEVKKAPEKDIAVLKSKTDWEEFWEKLDPISPIRKWEDPAIFSGFKDPITLLYYSPKGGNSSLTDVCLTKSGMRIILSETTNANVRNRPTIVRFLMKRTDLPIHVIADRSIGSRRLRK